MQSFLLAIDRLNTFIGKLFAWVIVILTVAICYEVFCRYALRSPTSWAYDVSYILYGTLFMMAGAYTLSKNGHVRGDMLYGFFKPRTQAFFDLVLYLVFFLPGVIALAWAGYSYAADSFAIREHSSITADGPPIYPFKAVIPVAGALLMLQGVAEIVRCIVCLKTGEWPSRLKDVAEIDVVEEQLAHSEYVDEESRKAAIEGVQKIDEIARQRGLGGD